MSSSKISTTTSPAYHTVELGEDIVNRSDEHLGRYSQPPQQQKPNGKRQEIAWNAFFLTFPMLVLTCLLFAFVFGYQIDRDEEPFEQLKGNESSLPDDDAYYVNLSSTMLIFLASWMSSLAPMLAGFALTLAAYPVAGKLFEDTNQQNRDRLLTPFQLHLALRLINGSTWSAIWNLMLYRLGWGKRVKAQGAALVSLFRVTLLVVFLSTLIFGADTWLHVVTKTVSIDQLSAVPNQDATYSLSLLSPNCTTTNNTIGAQDAAGLVCTMDTGTNLLQAGTTAYQTLNNQSNALSVLSDGPDPTMAYLTVTPSNREGQHDFSASTFGMQTSCRPITQSCRMAVAGGLATWNCSDNFAQAASNSASLTLSQAFFDDEAMTRPIPGGGSSNPFYYAVAAMAQLSANPTTNIADDRELASGSGAIAAVLLCSVGLYEITYDVVQGNVTHMTSTLSNASVANVFVPALSESGFGGPSLRSAFNMAVTVAESAQSLADQFALTFSKTALSVGAGSVVRRPATAAQRRSPRLVARVPKAPLLLLAAANLVFVAAGLALALFATVSATASSPAAHEVHERLSVAGLVAAAFEDQGHVSAAGAVERLYGEYYDGAAAKRVGVGRTPDGDFAFTVLEKEVGM